jgi:hypothetical protein
MTYNRASKVIQLPYAAPNQVSVQNWSAQFKDRECDNVLSAQGATMVE